MDIFHALPKVRNKAVHENYTSVEEGKALLQMAHSLCEWFMQTWDYENKLFVMPSDLPGTENVVDAFDEVLEENLFKKAEEKAVASNSVTKEKRRKQAARAASQR